MFLVQLLLPLYDNDQQALPRSLFRTVSEELIERFGGLTTYSRAPANGYWREDGENAVRDETVVYEVMVDELDRDWWAQYRVDLERRFRQKSLVVRAARPDAAVGANGAVGAMVRQARPSPRVTCGPSCR